MSLDFAVHTHARCAPIFRAASAEWGRLSIFTPSSPPRTRALPATNSNGLRRPRRKLIWLQTETEICAHCPACLPPEAAGEGEAVGCLGRVNYPSMSSKLANRVNWCSTHRSRRWPRLVHIMVDPESLFDGEATKELRRVTTAEGLRFLNCVCRFVCHARIATHDRQRFLICWQGFDLRILADEL